MTLGNEGNQNLQGGSDAGAQDNNTALQGQGDGAGTGAAAEGAGQAAGAAADKGATSFNWQEHLPPELQERGDLKRFTTIADLGKAYVEANQTISKSIRIPDTMSTPEQINEFYAKLGKPAEKSAYDFEYNPENEKYSLNKDHFEWGTFQEIADAANLTKDQYAALGQKYIDIQNQNIVNYYEKLEQDAAAETMNAEAALRKEWGDNYAANINNMQSKINKLYPQETLVRMEEAGLFRDIPFIKSQLSLTKMMSGDTVFIEGTAVENIPQTVESLRAKRDELMSKDYVGNKAQVNELNQKIVQLTQAQNNSFGKR